MDKLKEIDARAGWAEKAPKAFSKISETKARLSSKIHTERPDLITEHQNVESRN